MRWRDLRRSGNVEDRRGMSPGLVGGGLVTVVVAIVAMLLGVDPSALLQDAGEIGSSAPQASAPVGAPGDSAGSFAAAVLGSTEDTWTEVLARHDVDYRPPTLVLYENAVSSACGFNQSAVGPFYCPGDEKVYLDLSFFRELSTRYGASGDFAAAYVIAHEVGHHVQKLLGIERQVHAAMQGADEAAANSLSVRLELQADCFAGVWAATADAMQGVLQPGDVQEAMDAAAAVGDDALQRRARGYVVPESFTHGSSAQRMHWFREGMDGGDPANCDTFGSGA